MKMAKLDAEEDDVKVGVKSDSYDFSNKLHAILQHVTSSGRALFNQRDRLAQQFLTFACTYRKMTLPAALWVLKVSCRETMLVESGKLGEQRSGCYQSAPSNFGTALHK